MPFVLLQDLHAKGNSGLYSIERRFQFIPDDKLLVSYSDKTIRTWDLKTCKLIDKYQDTYHIDDHILTRDNNILFAFLRMDTQGKYTYRMISNKTKKSYATMDPKIVRFIYSESDDSKFIITGNSFPTSDDMHEVIIWSIQ